jgi:hypothetical protein
MCTACFSGNYPTGDNPESVVLGDVNGDGRLDILSANAGLSNTLGVVLSAP